MGKNPSKRDYGWAGWKTLPGRSYSERSECFCWGWELVCAFHGQGVLVPSGKTRLLVGITLHIAGKWINSHQRTHRQGVKTFFCCYEFLAALQCWITKQGIFCLVSTCQLRNIFKTCQKIGKLIFIRTDAVINMQKMSLWWLSWMARRLLSSLLCTVAESSVSFLCPGDKKWKRHLRRCIVVCL